MSPRVGWIARVALVAGLSIATLPRAQPALPAGKSIDDLVGSILRASKWQRDQVDVCWENPTRADARYRAITRQAVEETWEQHGRVRFTGWHACRPVVPGKPNPSGIRIVIEDVADPGPHVQIVGRYLDGRPRGMALNFTFENWGQDYCATNREFCVYAIAAHEFGHALGFTHEQNRPDAPDWCKEKAQGTVGDYDVTDYDPHSIMNYCSTTWNGDGKLSALDIAAVKIVYGG